VVWGQLGLNEGMAVSIELLDYFHDYIMAFLIGIFFFVCYFFLYVRLRPFIDKITRDSHFLETAWTVLPMFVLLFLAFPSLYLLYLMEELNTPAITIKVVAHQWFWEYQYDGSCGGLGFNSYMRTPSEGPGGFPSYYNLDVDNRLVLPELRSILFLLTSDDVLHSWTIPSLGIKMDCVPGRLNYLSRLGTPSGNFFGQCREICGSNHRFIPVAVEFVGVKTFINHLGCETW